MVGTELFPMPLSACIDEYRRWMQLAEQLERDDPVTAAYEIWDPLWFPLLSCISGDRNKAVAPTARADGAGARSTPNEPIGCSNA
jgi:hypothetical protein